MEEKFSSLENYNQKEEIMWFNEPRDNSKNINCRSSFYCKKNLYIL